MTKCERCQANVQKATVETWENGERSSRTIFLDLPLILGWRLSVDASSEGGIFADSMIVHREHACNVVVS